MKIYILGKTESFYESGDKYEVQEIIQAYADRKIAEAEIEIRQLETDGIWKAEVDGLRRGPAYWIEECELIV